MNLAHPFSSPPLQRRQERRTRKGGPLHPPVSRIAIRGPLLAVCVLSILIVIGVWRHVQQHREQVEFAKKAAQVSVNYVIVKRDSRPHDLILPGNIEAFQSTAILSRANGYLKNWYVDIGDKVKEGQLLAEIEAPDVDAQLRQAQATLAQTKASLDIATLNFNREKELLQKKVVSQQEFDQNRTNFDAMQAAVKAGEASVQNLGVAQGFQKITAPFSGVIATRSVDVGALVSAGGGSGGTPLFSIAQTDPLRIFVNVPQTNVPSVREGLRSKILVQEFPGRAFNGTVSRTAGALDPASRTMQAEVEIPNRDGTLYPGMYAQVKFELTDNSAPVIIPDTAFVFRPDGPEVVIATADSKIHWQKIKVGRDFGTQMEALSGLDENARVVLNPTDDLHEGMQVEAKPAETGKSEGAQPGDF